MDIKKNQKISCKINKKIGEMNEKSKSNFFSHRLEITNYGEI